MEEARGLARQIETLVGQLHRVLAIEVENLVAVLDGLVFLHLGHLLLRAAKQEEAVVIGEKQFSAMRSYRGRMRPAHRLDHAALKLAFTQNGAGNPGSGRHQHGRLSLVQRQWVLVGPVGERAMAQLHSEAEAARAASHDGFEQRKVPRLLHLREKPIAGFFVGSVHMSLLELRRPNREGSARRARPGKAP